jgi:hypothetical protein
MKDVHTVLYQKAQDLERVRREVDALLSVIPLLAEDESSPDTVYEMLLASRVIANNGNNTMADLERYYPFVRHMQTR